jgi:DEAD/DEAH box helicase domain-containing protein
LLPREAQAANSLQLLMAYLANPSETLWHGLAQLFCLAQGSAAALNSPEIQQAIAELALADHVDEWKGNEPGRQVGQALAIAPGLRALNLLDQARHGSRHPAASLRSIHFDPDIADSEQQQQLAWQEWLRQGNLFQFLPHALISTPGWGGLEQGSAIDPYGIWVGGQPAPTGLGKTATPDQAKQWQVLSQLVHPSCLALLMALQSAILERDLAPPEVGYELAGAKNEVLAEAELAWPEQKLAVILAPEDRPSFESAGWRCWSIDDSPDQIASELLAAL